MRRDQLLVAATVVLLCTLLLSAAAALLTRPPVPADLLPPGATLAHTAALGGERQLVVARLGPRQGLHDLYAHLSQRGWRLRRANRMPEDQDQVYVRRSLAGYLLEVAIVTRAAGSGGAVSITYWRCVRHLSCARS